MQLFYSDLTNLLSIFLAERNQNAIVSCIDDFRTDGEELMSEQGPTMDSKENTKSGSTVVAFQVW